MSPAGRQGFASPLSTVGPQGVQNDNVGGSQHEEVQQADHTAVGHHQQTSDVGVRAGELQQRVQVTDEVVDHVGPTEGQPKDQEELNQ